jgi:dihydroorotase-like cyclic amidohydrolase
MKADLIIKNGRVFDPVQKMDFVGDVVIKDGKIERPLKSMSTPRARPSTRRDASLCPA